jgi:hypothetical protein
MFSFGNRQCSHRCVLSLWDNKRFWVCIFYRNDGPATLRCCVPTGQIKRADFSTTDASLLCPYGTNGNGLAFLLPTLRCCIPTGRMETGVFFYRNDGPATLCCCVFTGRMETGVFSSLLPTLRFCIPAGRIRRRCFLCLDDGQAVLRNENIADVPSRRDITAKGVGRNEIAPTFFVP